MSVTLSISCVQNSQSVANNTSNVTVTVKATSVNGSYNLLSPSGSCTINGTRYTFTHNFDKNVTTTLFTKTLDITHNSDGTKILSYSATFATGVSSGTISASGSKTLTTIPRASVPTCSGGTMGKSITINTNRKSSSFTHTINIYVNGTSGTKMETFAGVGGSKAWTPSIATYAAKVTSATTLTVTIQCITYSGSTNVGTKTITCKLTVPSSVVPTVSSITASDSKGYFSTYGAYVLGKSNISATSSSSGIYGSTINKTVYKGTGIPTATGSRSVSVTVTDTRGRTATKSTTVTVVTYANPSCSLFSIQRCNSEGTLDDEGTYVMIKYSYKFTNVNSKNLNKGTATIKYRQVNTSTWTTLATLQSNSATYSKSSTGTKYGSGNFSTEKMYEFQLVLTDSFTTATKTITLSTAAPLLDFHYSGTGIGIGKVAQEENLLDVKLVSRFRSNVRHDGSIFLGNTESLYGLSTGGEQRNNIQPCNSNNNCVIGYGNYAASEGDTNIYGNNVSFTSIGDVKINGRPYGLNKVLWTGAYYMNASQTATLSDSVADQPHGIVLIFSEYYDSTAKDQSFISVFVPKWYVANKSGKGHSFQMTTSKYGYVATKYLYISSTQIVGNDVNDDTGTANGVTYENNRFVLRYVIGV